MDRLVGKCYRGVVGVYNRVKGQVPKTHLHKKCPIGRGRPLKGKKKQSKVIKENEEQLEIKNNRE